MYKELKNEVLGVKKRSDPKLDQKARTTLYVLRVLKMTIKEEWRGSWMVGSDCDDGDSYGRRSDKRVNVQSGSILAPTLIKYFWNTYWNSFSRIF